MLLEKGIKKKVTERKVVKENHTYIEGLLAASVAHEIKNSISSLKGLTQLLQAEKKDKGEYFKVMMEEIDKINKISSQLLNASKSDTDSKRFESITEMLHEVVLMQQVQGNTYNVDFDLMFDEDRGILCKRAQLKQVFINLIKNAVEEMPDGGKIIVHTKVNKTHVTVSIIDNGPGIPDHISRKLKDPFITTKNNGTGLGLMISNDIIDDHNGKLDFFNNKDRGTTFQINLPL